jgi:hypothetical protein
MINSTDPMFGTAKEQHPLSHGRFASIDVRDDADVSEIGNIKSHGNDSVSERFGQRTIH